MAPDQTATTWLAGFLLTVLAALTGHQYKKMSDLRAEIPEKYRDKDECNRICDTFRDTIASVGKDVKEGFREVRDDIKGLHKRMDSKEDKH